MHDWSEVFLQTWVDCKLMFDCFHLLQADRSQKSLSSQVKHLYGRLQTKEEEKNNRFLFLRFGRCERAAMRKQRRHRHMYLDLISLLYVHQQVWGLKTFWVRSRKQSSSIPKQNRHNHPRTDGHVHVNSSNNQLWLDFTYSLVTALKSLPSKDAQ